MKRIDVFGGVYRERCAFPEWNQVFGSAGRAAAGLSALVDEVYLHTFLAPTERKMVDALLGSFGVMILPSERSGPIGFDYLHSLAAPDITPSLNAIEEAGELVAKVKTAVCFGMLEGSFRIDAQQCVYDPQSTHNPQYFKDTGSTAKRLAIIMNLAEARKLTGEVTSDAAAEKIIEVDLAEAVIIKNGLYGATYYGPSGRSAVPAYEAASVFTIGSGDIFVAAFAFGWALAGLDGPEAAGFASRATAAYVASRSLPIISPAEAAERSWVPVKPAGGNIYLAGPFRELGQRWMIEDAREQLSSLGMKVFSPVHDIGRGPAEEVVSLDLDAIEQCDAVFAFLNGSSPGTVFEVGYATGLNRPVFCVAQNMREADLKLPLGSGCFVYDDYVTALFHIAWRD
jgi:hypothetical protein